jgi:cell division protein FtsL
MIFSARDLAKLQWHLLLAIALLAAAISLGFWSQHREQQAKLERDIAEKRLQQIDNQLRQVRFEEQEIKERTAVFQKLVNSGIAGNERRLEWIELLRDLQRQFKLSSMNYEFGPQLRLESGNSPAYTYQSSHLRIQLRLLHEEDLLEFLGHLQKRAKAMVLNRSCRLSRSLEAGQANQTMATLAADCNMDWITLHLSSEVKQP